jgi:hypothetical protein
MFGLSLYVSQSADLVFLPRHPAEGYQHVCGVKVIPYLGGYFTLMQYCSKFQLLIKACLYTIDDRNQQYFEAYYE